MTAKKRTKKFRLRFYLILLVPVLLLGAFIGYKIMNPSTGRLRSATVNGSMEFTGIVIRKETVAEGGDYTNLHFLVGEGDAVTDQQPVAVLYKKGYNDQLSEIVNQEQLVYKQQLTLLKLASADGSTLPDELITFNNAIDETINEMTAAAMVSTQYDYLTLEEQLRSLLEARETLLQQIAPADSALSANYQILEQLQNSFSSQEYLLNNAGAGYISFHLDGYENAMNVETLTASQVRKIVSSPVSGSYNTTGLYRIIDPNGFYIAFTVKADDSNRLLVGSSYEMQVKYQDFSYTGKVIAERASATYVLYVLEVNADAYQVLENRTMVFTMGTTASGVSIPVAGLYFNGGVPYVYVYTGSSYEPVAVEILASDGETAVVQAKNKEIQLKEGLKFEYHEEPAADTSTPTATPPAATEPSATPAV